MTNDTNITNDKDINANIAHDDHFNDSIVNEVILEDMKKNRIDHMKYLPDMEVLDSDIMDRVVAEMDAYDYDQYTAADVRAALSHEYRTLEDFKALLSPAAQPFIEEIKSARRQSFFAVGCKNMSCRHICGTKLFGFYGIFYRVDRGSDNLEELLIIVSAF